MTQPVGKRVLAPNWAAALVERNLEPGEVPLSNFEPDLDSRLKYSPGLVVLTDRRLLSFSWESSMAGEGPPLGAPERVEQWILGVGMELSARDHAGVGTLELHTGSVTLGWWRYTAGRAAGARLMVEDWEALRHGLAPPMPAAAPHPAMVVCHACGLPLRPSDGVCDECGGSRTPSSARSLFRLLSVAQRYWAAILLGFVLTLASTASSLIPPYLTMPLLDDILIPFQNGNQVDIDLVKWYLLGLAGASFLAWALTWAQMYILSWVSERIAADLRTLTYSHLQRLSLEYFGGKRTGDLMSRVSNDTDRICFFLSVYVLDFATDVLMLLMTAAILISIDVGMAIGTLLPMPFIATLVFRVQGRLRRGFSLGSRAWAELTSILADTIPGIRVVKAFAQEEREVQRFQRANEGVLRTNDRVNRVWAYFNAVVVLLTDLGVLAVWLFGIWRVFHHSITVGVLTAFVAYISRFYGRLDSMSRMASATQRAATSAQRLFAILDRVPKVAEPPAPVHPGRLEGGIELRGVSFRFGMQSILRDINLSIGPGEVVGLVGRSGAGKTTLINLICRFYDPTAGAVLVDGTDIRHFPINEYRRNVGLVLQEPFLFYGTVAENIAYGRPKASRQEIIAAARAAQAHEFILRLPNGYESLVGERGQFLSGGERQRVSIARALLIDPRILILDEATSSVDSETERDIQLALENLIRGRTTIAIAHRLSTLQRADRLVVLDRGEIVEVGRHEDLLALGGVYSKLYQVQVDTLQGRQEEAGGEGELESPGGSKEDHGVLNWRGL